MGYYDTPTFTDREFELNDAEWPLHRLVSGWQAKIALAHEAASKWREVAEECMRFYCDSYEFMWDAKYPDSFKQQLGKLAPMFSLTINKAFELVALVGPVLYHNNPVRQVNPRVPFDLPPELFPAEDPAAQEVFQTLMFQQQKEHGEDKIRATLLERYLNYTPNEMPFGGLANHAEMAITEALIKGRGCLITEPWQPPGSDQVLTICRHEHPERVLIDPDATNVDEAMWIAIECIHPTWQVEREYKLPKGSVKGNMESTGGKGEQSTNDQENAHRAMGHTNDLVKYYKVYSKMGMGQRMTGTDQIVKDALEDFGDHCFLVIAKGVPYPLNLPPKEQKKPASALKKAVEWPCPYWRDGRWPVTFLDFYRKPMSPYPIPPLAPGLGELKFLNLMMNHLTHRVWTTCRNILAVPEEMEESVKDVMENGKDLALFKVPASVLTRDGSIDLSKLIAVIKFPEVNLDVWKIIEAVSIQFDKRVGLTDLVYGMTSFQMRSASEANAKQAQVSVRPDYMAKKVETFMTESARKEAMCARWFVQPNDIVPILGQAGAFLWQQYVMERDVDKVVRELEYRLEANSARKPNKDRDAANINEILPFMLPMLQQYAVDTGNTEPLNLLLDQWAKAIDWNSPIKLDQWAPPPPPPGTPDPAQQEAEMEQQRMAAEMELEQQKAMVEQQTKMQEFELKKQEAEMRLQEMIMKAQLEADKARQEMALEQQKFTQEMRQDQLQFQQDLTQDKLQADQQMRTQTALANTQMKTQTALAETKVNAQKQQTKAQVNATNQTTKAQVQAAKAKAAAAPKKPDAGKK